MTLSAQSQYVFTSKPSVNLRQMPSTSAAKVGTLEKGQMLPLVDSDWETEWNKVSLNGKDAYVSQSVCEICDAEIPKELFGKSLASVEAADKVRFQGNITINPIGNQHAVIEVTWMRVNLPAETYNYLADVNSDGTVVATHQLMTTWVDTDLPLEKSWRMPIDSTSQYLWDSESSTIRCILMAGCSLNLNNNQLISSTHEKVNLTDEHPVIYDGCANILRRGR